MYAIYYLSRNKKIFGREIAPVPPLALGAGGCSHKKKRRFEVPAEPRNVALKMDRPDGETRSGEPGGRPASPGVRRRTPSVLAGMDPAG